MGDTMEWLQRAAQMVDAVRQHKPLVHQITNFVTVNDCANMTLAIGASPVMANDPAEAVDMVKHAQALVINIGVLQQTLLETMIAAGQQAARQRIPVIFDPVGAGATPFRTAAARRIIEEVPLTVIRGNLSEIKALAGDTAPVRGVDSTAAEHQVGEAAQQLAQDLSCVVAITGAVDVIAVRSRLCYIRNGHRLLSRITGTGCMASALVGSCCAAFDDPAAGAAAGIAAMGIAGELAFKALQPGEGLGSFKMRLFDAVSLLKGADILRYGSFSYNWV